MTIRMITGTLKLRTPLHIGTGNSTETVDDLLRRDAQGRLLIPGASVAGALRAIATRLAPRLGGSVCLALKGTEYGSRVCGCLTCELFGDVNPQETDGEASGVIVYDAVLNKNPETQIRDGVGVDRASGVAARKERLKFDLEVLPKDTEFKLRMELDRRLTDNERALQLLAVSLAEWEGGRGAVGGRVGRGLGALDLTSVYFNEQKLETVESLVDFLKTGPDWQGNGGDGRWVETQVTAARSHVQAWSDERDAPVARSWVLAEFTLAADGPFLINDPVRSGQGGFDHAPLLAAYRKGATPVLPGSSLRGVLRSQAERIARTMATLADAGDGTHFKMSCPACNPLTMTTSDEVASCSSFIRKLRMKERQDLERKGAEDKLCLACRLFGSTWSGSRLRVEDAYMLPGTGMQKVMDFLAIDRFTGGGREGAKFDVAVLWEPQFRVRLFADNPQAWELGWLALVLRDLHEGLAPLGSGSAKGFGQATLKDPVVIFGILHDTDFPWPSAPDDATDEKAHQLLEKGRFAAAGLLQGRGQPSGLYQTISYHPDRQSDWLDLANGWVQDFQHEVAERPRSRDFVIERDSYFTEKSGYWLPALYPMEVSA